ncbi:hypothetical protein MUK42_14040 [Musa troglodytarum]|nr:hypothetical protein MUK42_14040 [Musa troglodytarum]
MEGKNIASPSFTSIADESLGRKEGNPSSRSSSSSSPGYFSTVIPPASTVIAKDLSHSDLCWTLNKQRCEGRIGSTQKATADRKSQGSPTKRHITQNKEEKPVCPDEFLESSYFGSSVHYGARDFYTSSSATQTSEISHHFSNFTSTELMEETTLAISTLLTEVNGGKAHFTIEELRSICFSCL